MNGTLKGKRILLTDALHFVGPGTVPAYLDQGAELMVHDDAFQDTEKRTEFEQAFPSVLVSTAKTPEELADDALARLDGLDVLVSNDAYPAKKLPIESASPEELQETLNRLVVRGFALVGKIVPAMKAQGHGKIIFMTSAGPMGGIPNFTPYAVARAAMNGLVKSLALELAPHNIQVNAVAPNFLDNPDYYPESLMSRPELAAKVLAQVPLGRLGSQDEMAALMTFMAGDGSGFLTGQIIPFAGGWV